MARSDFQYTGSQPPSVDRGRSSGSSPVSSDRQLIDLLAEAAIFDTYGFLN
jgi:hypothetical protein